MNTNEFVCVNFLPLAGIYVNSLVFFIKSQFANFCPAPTNGFAGVYGKKSLSLENIC